MTGKKQLVSGEMHYPRVPREYWRARMQMARAMGLNAISTYVFWNLHEPHPESYDFTGGKDVAAFVREAGRSGLDVILRPGPYVCAEWDFGGLPAWLLAHGPIAVRTRDERYMRPVRRWLRRLGEELAPLQRARGGPIVAIQLENEYGAYGDDAAYLASLRTALDTAGFGESPYYTIDQPKDLARGALPDLPIAATFGSGEPERGFRALRDLRPDAPLLCGEYWAGWFDHWGEPHQQPNDSQQNRDLAWMLRSQACVNIYMFHGGTNFGFWNGANDGGAAAYQPTTTSYDYLAALDEAGRPTAKYHAFRETIGRASGAPLPPIPPPPLTIEIPAFALVESASLEALAGTPIHCDGPAPMESFGQSLGYIRYRTTLAGPGPGRLEIDGLCDYATISIDGRVAGRLDRRLGERAIDVNITREGATLDVLVENCGRINYGPALADQRKGITRAVRCNDAELRGWEVVTLPLDDLGPLRFRARRSAPPAFYRGRFELSEPADTFLDIRALGKGVLFVNGRHAGRFWNAGPQRSLYVPGVWLRRGINEVVVFDVTDSFEMFMGGAREPITRV